MRVVALTFHDIVENLAAAPSHGDAFYHLAAREMEALLSRLHKHGYRTVSSKAFRAWQRGSGELPARTVVFTFDDGYASHLELAASLLIRYRYTGTFFVTPEKIGRPGYLSWDQLKKLVFLGMEIGSHGLTHKLLTELDREALNHELTESKRVLEERLGISIQSIAAPGGFWNSTVAEAAQQAGYDAFWVSTMGMNGKETNPFALRRVVVRSPLEIDRIVSMVEGQPSAFWWAGSQQAMIRLIKRVLGVYWYERLKRRVVPNA